MVQGHVTLYSSMALAGKEDKMVWPSMQATPGRWSMMSIEVENTPINSSQRCRFVIGQRYPATRRALKSV